MVSNIISKKKLKLKNQSKRESNTAYIPKSDGRNYITIYVDKETSAWLDQICGVLGTTRGKAITKLLKMLRENALAVMALGTADPDVKEIFRKMLKNSV